MRKAIVSGGATVKFGSAQEIAPIRLARLGRMPQSL